MKRTNSSFVLIEAGFFRDQSTKNLYAVTPGFYKTEDCVVKNEDNQNMLAIPENACVLIPRAEAILKRG